MAKSLSGQNFASWSQKTRQGNGSHSKPSHGRKKYRGQGKTLILFQMFKLLIASGVAVSAAVLASPAQADWYANPELNMSQGWTLAWVQGLLKVTF